MSTRPASRRLAAGASGPAPAGTRARAWIITGLLLVFMLINFADKAVLGLAAKAIMHDLGLSATQYGLVSSGFFFLFSIAALVVGFVSDRVSTKWLIFVMALIWALTQVPMITTVGFGVLLASRVVLGAAEGPAFPVANHAVHKWFPNSARSVPSSILVIGAPLGVVVGAPVLTWVIAHHGWHVAFAGLAAIGFAWCVAWLFVGSDGPAHDDAAVEAAPSRVPYRRILTSGTWLSCVLAGFASYWALALLISWLPPYLETVLGYSTTATGGLVALAWGVGGAAQILQGIVTTRLMRRGASSRTARGILGGVCVAGAGFAGAAFVLVPPGPVKLVLLFVAFSIGSVMFPISQTVCAEIAPPSRRGGVLGAYAAVYSTAGVVAPFLTGKLVDAGHGQSGYTTTFLVSAGLLIVGGLSAALFIRPERDARRLLQEA